MAHVILDDLELDYSLGLFMSKESLPFQEVQFFSNGRTKQTFDRITSRDGDNDGLYELHMWDYFQKNREYIVEQQEDGMYPLPVSFDTTKSYYSRIGKGYFPRYSNQELLIEYYDNAYGYELKDDEIIEVLSINIPFSGKPHTVKDLNNDGLTDFCFVNQASISFVYASSEGGLFEPPVTIQFSPFEEFQLEDLNSDGYPEIITVGQDREFVVVYSGDQASRGEATVLHEISLPGKTIKFLNIFDIDFDGKSDLVFHVPEDRNVQAFFAGGAIPFSYGEHLIWTPHNRELASLLVTEFNLDGLPDFFFTSQGTTLDFHQYMSKHGEPYLFNTFVDRDFLLVEDFNNDFRPDVLLSHSEIIYGTGDRSLSEPIRQGAFFNFAVDSIFMDINKDGNLDNVQLRQFDSVSSFLFVATGFPQTDH